MKRMKKYEKQEPVYADIDWAKAVMFFERQKDTLRNEKGEGSENLNESTKKILVTLAAAGLVGLVFAFPTIVPAIGAVAGVFRPVGWRGKRAIKRLERQKWVSVSENENGFVTVRITKEGMMKALTYELKNMSLIKPKQWDKKWRVVIFDVPEKHKRLRDIFRIRLGQLGLYLLQESVFVSPYPCFNEVEFLRELYGVSFSVRYLLVERLEDDAYIRQHFKL